MRSTLLCHLMVVCLSVLLGCADEPEPPAIYWVGEHIAFGAVAPEQVCGGTLETIDQRAGEVWELLESDTKQVVDFYLLDDLTNFCPATEHLQGCTIVPGNTIYSTNAPDLHEIVHARSGDKLPLVLEEGLATYLGDGFPFQELAPRSRLAELLAAPETRPSTSGEYARVAHFVMFLSETFGWDSILVLEDGLGLKSSAPELDAVFETATGYGTEALLALYADYPDCRGFVFDGLVCASKEPIQLNFVETEIERTLDCTSSDALGPYRGLVYVEEVIEIGASIGGMRLISLRGDGVEQGGFAVLRSCASCSDAVFRFNDAPYYTIPEESLPPGLYTLRFYLPSDASPATIGIRIQG